MTADDLGISPGVNAAVVRAYSQGVLRFASLMVTGAAAEDAANRVRRCRGLGLGLHLVLCAGRSATPPSQLVGLVDGEGRFPSDPVSCGLRYFFLRRLEPLIEREIRAQFELYAKLGLPPGHVDGHLNIHVHPVVFPIVARVSREYGFRRIRLPGGELWTSLRYSRERPAKQLMEGLAFFLLRRYLLLRHSHPMTEVPKRTYGLLRSGMMHEEYVLRILRTLPEGTSEVYFHPFSDPASVVTDIPREGHHTYTELETLTSPRIREAIGTLGLSLATV